MPLRVPGKDPLQGFQTRQTAIKPRPLLTNASRGLLDHGSIAALEGSQFSDLNINALATLSQPAASERSNRTTFESHLLAHE